MNCAIGNFNNHSVCFSVEHASKLGQTLDTHVLQHRDMQKKVKSNILRYEDDPKTGERKILFPLDKNGNIQGCEIKCIK